jgi:hypothetical protein
VWINRLQPILDASALLERYEDSWLRILQCVEGLVYDKHGVDTNGSTRSSLEVGTLYSFTSFAFLCACHSQFFASFALLGSRLISLHHPASHAHFFTLLGIQLLVLISSLCLATLRNLPSLSLSS